MKKFWCVSTKYFDSGKVKSIMYQIESEEKPKDGMVENRMCDEYHDYFDNYEDAKKWWEDAQKA